MCLLSLQVFHYNRVNKGDCTRVSFDFRVIPLSKYEAAGEVKRSVQTARRFTVGDGELDYYSTYDKRTGGPYVFDASAARLSPATVDDTNEGESGESAEGVDTNVQPYSEYSA